MGSVSWRTLIPYDPDVGTALARAQQEVFQRGDYGFTNKMKNIFGTLGIVEKLFDLLPDMPRAETIEEARARGEESGEGTCSVLDVESVGAHSAPGVTAPLPPALLRRLGTDRPTLQQVEAELGAFYDSLERGSSAYIVCYQNGEPKHYLFIGMSYD